MSDASLQLDYDDQWVQVDLDADPEPWARALVGLRWAEEDLDPDPVRADAIVAGIAHILGGLENLNAGMAFLLYPAANDPVVTVVGVHAFDREPGETLDEVAQDLRFPDEMLEAPVEQSAVETASGPALRLIQRYREPLSPGVEQVREHVIYAWLLPDDDSVVTVSTTFVDLVAAGIWRDALDELALSLTLDR